MTTPYEIKNYTSRITPEEYAEVQRILNEISLNDPKPTVDQFLSFMSWAVEKSLIEKK